MEYARLKQIYEAAGKLFIQQGYAKTVIGDIAGEGGFAVGTVYLYFTGKKAIKYFVLKCTVDPGFIMKEFTEPISDDLAFGLEAEVKQALDNIINNFAAPLTNQAADYTFEQLVSDAYDLMFRYAVGCLFIEKNPKDCQGLAAYYKKYRERFFTAMLAYVNLFISRGEIRPLKYPQYTVNLIIETISWWAMDRRYNSYQPPELSHEVAKEVVLDNLISAYTIKK